MTLRAQYEKQMSWALQRSVWQKTPCAVALVRDPELPTRIVVQGGSVPDVMWEFAAERGARFKVLAVFQHGTRIA